METFRARTFSGSGEDVFEIESGMELHERTHEHTNRLLYTNGDIFSGRFSQSAEDSDEHSVHKKTSKEFSYLYTYLSTVLFIAVLILENIFHFRLFTDSHASISFYWLESCVIALFFRFWGRKRIRSFRSQASHFLPLLFLHVVTVTTFALDFNKAAYGNSGGSESYLVSLALMAPVVLLASWVTSRQSYPDKIIIMVSISCSLLMVLFCSMEDPYAHYKVSFTDGAFGFMMCASLSFFTVHGKKYLPKATRAELLYLLNFSCVVCLPFMALLLGELPALEDELFNRGTFDLVFSVFVLAVLRLASQAACLYQLKYSSPLLNATTRGFAWIWSTIAIALMTPAHKGVLMVTVFFSFWIYGLFTYLPIMCSDLEWI